MTNRIRMFEAHNIEGNEGNEVLVFAEGDEEAIKAFRVLAETKRPAHSEVSSIAFEDYDGDVMKIGEFAQFCSIVQLNKAIPVLLDMRDDMKAMRKTTDATLDEIKGMREDIQPGYGMTLRQVQSDIRAIKERLGMQ